ATVLSPVSALMPRSPKVVVSQFSPFPSLVPPPLLGVSQSSRLLSLPGVRSRSRSRSRYTPEIVEETCGISQEDFHYLAESIAQNSNPERTTVFACMSRIYPQTVTVGIGALSIEEVVAVARYGAQVEIAPESLEAH